MEPTLSSETSSFILQTPGKFPKEHRLHSKHGESLKTTTVKTFRHSRYYAMLSYRVSGAGVTQSVLILGYGPDDRNMVIRFLQIRIFYLLYIVQLCVVAQKVTRKGSPRQTVKPTTHTYLVPGSRFRGILPIFHHTSLLLGTYLLVTFNFTLRGWNL